MVVKGEYNGKDILWVEELPNENLTVIAGNNCKAKILKGNSLIGELLQGESMTLTKEVPERIGLFRRSEKPIPQKYVIFYSASSFTVLWGRNEETKTFDGKTEEIKINGSATFSIGNPSILKETIKKATITTDDIVQKWGYNGTIANYAVEVYEYVKLARQKGDTAGIKEEIAGLMLKTKSDIGNKFVIKRMKDGKTILDDVLIENGLFLQSVTVTGFSRTVEEDKPKMVPPQTIVRPMEPMQPMQPRNDFSEKNICPTCGNAVNKNVLFCTVCGRKIR